MKSLRRRTSATSKIATDAIKNMTLTSFFALANIWCRVATIVFSPIYEGSVWLSTLCNDPVNKNRRSMGNKINQRHRKHTRYRRYKITRALAFSAAMNSKVPTNRSDPVNCRFDTDSFRVGFDTLATACISNNPKHFKNFPTIPTKKKCDGIGGSATIKYKGTVVWYLADDGGRRHKFEINNALYIPDSPICILSPQQVAQQSPLQQRAYTTLTQGHEHCIFTWGPKGKFKRTIPLDKGTNTPIIRSADDTRSYRRFCFLAQSPEEINRIEATEPGPHLIPLDDESTVESETLQTADSDNHTVNSIESTYPVEENIEDFNHNISNQESRVSTIETDEEVAAATPYADLLRWHYRLGHMSFNKIKAMSRAGLLPKNLANVQNPKCACCYYGKAHRKPWRTRAQPRRIKVATKPGEVVSVDTLQSSTPGFIGILKGILTKRRYNYATIFVDHFSDLSYVHLHSDNTSLAIVQAKESFEAYARTFHVNISHYHCDNGRFADNAFRLAVTNSKQSISFCSVNGHHQNGRAEKRIRDLRENSRSTLLHSIARWPSAITTNLWPYAIRHANNIRNSTVDKRDGTSPINRFSGINVDINLKDFHTFGCPVYSLDSNLASGKSIPHWSPRSQLGIYLGQSPRHARNCSLVLNLKTGHVSPQFHVSHDDFFETVRDSTGNSIPVSNWQSLSGFSAKSPATSRNIKKTHYPTETVLQEEIPDRQSHDTSTTTMQDVLDLSSGINDTQLDDGHTDVVDDPEVAPTSEPSVTPHVTEENNGAMRRSQRTRKPSEKMRESIETGEYNSISYLSSEKANDESSYYECLHQEDYKLQELMANPISFLSKTDKDTMHYHQAMKEPDKKDFQIAMVKEFNDHIERGHYEIMLKSDVPKGHKILDAIWSMKRKRDIVTQKILKHKARLTIHGGQQEYGINYTETYSPVVNWTSVRFLLAMAKLNKWHTRQIDFVLAYPQADVEYDLFMKLPRGLHYTDGVSPATHCVKILKNIYGQKQAGRIWNKYLTKGLLNIGFRQSRVDECVFYREDVIFAVFVDDGIFYSPNEASIQRVLKDMKNNKKTKCNFDIEDKGSISDYLGLNFEELEGGRLKLSQPHLIENIIEEVKIPTKEKGRHTPAHSSYILQRDKDGISFNNKTFDYRSVIGKLNYLEKCSRPDIAYAVHQCARFSSDPKQSHAKAVIHLVKYLKATRDKGIIFSPDENKGFRTYADADFSGNWNKQTAHVDPSTSKSRTGYFISIFNCPLIWISKLQSQIALSTTEAEYIALSQALRDTIPLMNFSKEVHAYGFQGQYIKPTIYCKAFEDNMGALEIATVPKMRPRTKHINLVYHHFREHVRNGEISIESIETKNQIADILTKPLAQNAFQYLRKKLLQW